MAIDRARPLLCFVHCASDLDSSLGLVEAGGEGWGSLDIVQVRGKSMDAGDLEKLVERWMRIASSREAPLIIVNDRLDVALATGADGVHVGRDDLPVDEVRQLAPAQFVIGMSAHDRREIELAQDSGADYAGLGAFYPSRTKPEASVLEGGETRSWEPIEGLSIPVIAIGGITASRVGEVLSVPAVTGVAVSEAIQGSRGPEEAIRELRAATDRAWSERAACGLQA
jgi:thiamine-phosphate pyrophosphorylase